MEKKKKKKIPLQADIVLGESLAVLVLQIVLDKGCVH